MAANIATRVGPTSLKNPIVCGSGEHVVSAAGIRAALEAGAAAVVAKSVNESAAARAQFDRADYALFDSRWRPLPFDFDAPDDTTLACRSGLSRQPFEDWLAMVAELDDEAKDREAYVVASLILGELDPALDMARRVEAAGIRILEFNIGTPYGDEAVKGAVSTERAPANVAKYVSAMRAAVTIPLWVKVSGQSERVSDLAAAAGEAGADAVVLAGRVLGMLPDLETQRPVLDTNLGFGGFWSLPRTCYWLARTRRGSGADLPLIATNGIRDGGDVVRTLLAGASAAEMATAVMTGGFATLSRAVDEVAAYLEQNNLAVDELIGRAADRLMSFQDVPAVPGNRAKVTPS